jgi:hypothetical protein
MNIFSLLALKRANNTVSWDALPTQLQDAGVIQTKVDVTAATFTIPNDNTKFFCCDRPTAQTITIPTGLSAFPVGGIISIVQLGEGIVTLTEGVGVTIRKSTDTLAVTGINKTVQLLKLADNDWLALGSFT